MVKQRQTVGNLAIDGDLTYEILLQLPAKTVLRCGAMSKAWCRITTNPTFLSDHAHHRPLEALLYNSFGKAAGKIDMELDTLSVAVHYHAAVPERKGIGHHVICNPTMRQWAELPRLTGGRNLIECHREFGFYFHLQYDEYHLLCHCTMNLAGRLTNHMVAFDMVAETFKEMMPPLVTTKFFANLLAMDKFLMASKFTDLGMDLWVLEGYGVMDERWELWHHVVLPWQLSATLKRPLLIEGGDSGDVIMGTTYDLGVYNVKSKIFRVVVTVKPPDALLLSRDMLRESLVPHTFFNNQQPNPTRYVTKKTTCLPLFRFLS
ncbi:uncharacterized protein [Oryza sativa Japonica Group]|uniref:uncharacterized protein n=1 Tax=Oryza sativa subsp. japonica TaxID=39947 RepID=UPI0000F13EE1|nr:hypothetical protein [Oryza sativa Japonica Group]